MSRVKRHTLTLILLGLLLAGCSLMPETAQPPAGDIPAAPTSQGSQLYQDASAALLAGRTATAAAWFANLARATSDPGLARKARFGQAAAALAAARTPQEAAAAMELWRAWQQKAPQTLDQEDPRLLGPALKGLEACLAIRPAGGAAGNGDAEARQRLARLQEENQRLKKQLAELEALHKELNERKNRLGK